MNSMGEVVEVKKKESWSGKFGRFSYDRDTANPATKSLGIGRLRVSRARVFLRGA